MKRTIIYIRQFFIILFLIFCFLNEAHSQGTDTIKSIKRNKPGFFFGFSIGPSQTNIKNTGTLSISNLASNSQNAFFGSAEVGYLLSKYIGFSSGINYTSYKSQLTLDTYQNSYSTTDSENDAFEMRVTGSKIQELLSIDVLSVPFYVDLRVPFSKKVGAYFKGGVNLAFPLNQKYTSSGTFTYKGFYPEYNDLLENLPAYGFPTDKSLSVNGQLKLKAVGVSSIISAGLDYFIKKKMQIAIGINYNSLNLGLKDTSIPTDKFQLSPDAEHINSFVGGSSKTTAHSIGAEISFRYYLK
jgi:hypothetical protein